MSHSTTDSETRTGPAIDALAGSTVLVTGVSGYIGGELVQPLLDAGATVRVLTRRRSSIAERPWSDRVEVVEADANDPQTWDRALPGVDVAYYLLHSMAGGSDFAARDQELAEAFAAAAERHGVARIVYLGGIHPDGEELSEHLESRVAVGRVLLDSTVPAAVLQAGIVLGPGSTSYQMMRYLAARLPVMVAPRWVRSRIQPIAIDDAVHYLVGAATLDPGINRTFDIAGPEVLTYAEMLQRYVRVTTGRNRLVLDVPVFTPGLASHWVGLVTPVNADVAKPLVGSLLHDVVASERDLEDLIGAPPGGPTGFDDAVRRAEAELHPDTGLRNLIGCVAAVAACASVGAIATAPRSLWYRLLRKPAWQPPPATFGIVWTSLYAVLAATSASVLTRLEAEGRTEEAEAYRRALAANLALNAAWSVVFWRIKLPGVAAAESAALTVSAADLARRAGTVSSGHRALLIPYAAWCGFATGLSGAIARRNPRSRG